MKKIIIFLAMSIMAIVAVGQERTYIFNNGNALDLTTTKWIAYNGTASDYLIPTTRDTIDYVVLVKNQTSDPLNFYAVFTFDTIAGADTTVAISVDYKMFNSQSYSSLIGSVNTSAISAETLVTKTTLGVTSYETRTTASAVDLLRQTIIANNDTITVAQRVQTAQVNPVLYYRYLKFRLIINGNDHTGTGIKVKRLEIQFFN